MSCGGHATLLVKAKALISSPVLEGEGGGRRMGCCCCCCCLLFVCLFVCCLFVCLFVCLGGHIKMVCTCLSVGLQLLQGEVWLSGSMETRTSNSANRGNS